MRQQTRPKTKDWEVDSSDISTRFHIELLRNRQIQVQILSNNLGSVGV